MAPSTSRISPSRIIVSTSIFAALGALWLARSHSTAEPHCRCFPGDECWPSLAEWDYLNETVGGKLIATVPIASPCHDTFPGVSYDAEECARIQENWAWPELHYETTHSPMTAFFANMSCDPFTPRDAQCIVGAYVAYAVNATGASDYRAVLAFCEKHNIRLVIRNTGHDYMRKSTGAGALALWTHNLKERILLDYDSAAYTGKAIKLGAGVQSFEAQELANENGFVMVTGDCPSVGVAGGYAQGGGTSPLGSLFGLAADQVLEWEVVTATGELLTATPEQNSDLYWALSGGGGGTYAVVLSMTAKLHRNMPTAGATLSFTEPSESFWDIMHILLRNIPGIQSAGGTILWQLFPGNTFFMPQGFLPNATAEEFRELLTPTLQALDQSGIPYEVNISELNLGGTLVPRSSVASDSATTSLTDAIKSVVGNGGILATVCMDVSRPPISANSVHPAWRDTLFLAFIGTMYDRLNMTANLADQQLVTNVLVPAMERLSDVPAAYLNEADFNQPNWQRTFYGDNYAELLAIKRKYDPKGVFWGPTAVGSERWEVAQDGRLCMIHA
ncbi:hypothetical protein SLS62_007936 [Diatrype stigma]|uniref:FAD-binding PCMH-type domain-containing protein n=1 Tax=Diatrype stigma TaxID=117547 RepID=A0AAN9YQB9_9PEZI